LQQLNIQLKARNNKKEPTVSYLKDQVYARIAGEHQRLYLGLGQVWRKQGGKIMIGTPSKDQTDEGCFMQLVAAMIKEEDSETCGINDGLMTLNTQARLHSSLTVNCGGLHES
jgi:hypothetical protein